MINLLNIFRSILDVIEINDISLIRNLCNQTISDIQNITGGDYSIEIIQSADNRVIIPYTCNKFIGLYLNDIKLRQINTENMSLMKSPADWYDDIDYYCFCFQSERLITLPGNNDQNSILKLEYFKKYSEVTHNDINLPEQYQDFLLKGILSKIFYLPKYLNETLGNHYLQLYQNTLTGLKG